MLSAQNFDSIKLNDYIKIASQKKELMPSFSSKLSPLPNGWGIYKTQLIESIGFNLIQSSSFKPSLLSTIGSGVNIFHDKLNLSGTISIIDANVFNQLLGVKINKNVGKGSYISIGGINSNTFNSASRASLYTAFSHTLQILPSKSSGIGSLSYTLGISSGNSFFNYYSGTKLMQLKEIRDVNYFSSISYYISKGININVGWSNNSGFNLGISCGWSPLKSLSNLSSSIKIMSSAINRDLNQESSSSYEETNDNDCPCGYESDGVTCIPEDECPCPNDCQCGCDPGTTDCADCCDFLNCKCGCDEEANICEDCVCPSECKCGCEEDGTTCKTDCPPTCPESCPCGCEDDGLTCKTDCICPENCLCGCEAGGNTCKTDCCPTDCPCGCETDGTTCITDCPPVCPSECTCGCEDDNITCKTNCPPVCPESCLCGCEEDDITCKTDCCPNECLCGCETDGISCIPASDCLFLNTWVILLSLKL